MGTPAPKPANFEELSRAWNDPDAFRRQVAMYQAQIAAAHEAGHDWTEVRRGAR